MAIVEPSFTLRMLERQCHVGWADVHVSKPDNMNFVRVARHGFGRMCFGELPNKWVTRSIGMHLITKSRNEAASQSLLSNHDAMQVPTPNKRMRRSEKNEKRGDKSFHPIHVAASDA